LDTWSIRTPLPTEKAYKNTVLQENKNKLTTQNTKDADNVLGLPPLKIRNQKYRISFCHRVQYGDMLLMELFLVITTELRMSRLSLKID